MWGELAIFLVVKIKHVFHLVCFPYSHFIFFFFLFQIVYNSVSIAPTEYQMQFPLSDPPVSFAPKTSKEEPARRGRSKARTQVTEMCDY